LFFLFFCFSCSCVLVLMAMRALMIVRRQPDQLSSWWWYKDAVMGMFWSLCNVLVLHDALLLQCRCGTNQTGGFVQGSSASDGLLGLGLADISVPSTMARQGVAQNSFSMCFALDGSGRILFGDRGPPKQPSTPLVKISNLWAFPINTYHLTSSGLHTYLLFPCLPPLLPQPNCL
jgi:hypothetical protein